MRWTALEARQITQDTYLYEETVHYFTQYVKKMRDNYLVWKYKSSVIESLTEKTLGSSNHSLCVNYV